jgi:hypothetical protein
MIETLLGKFCFYRTNFLSDKKVPPSSQLPHIPPLQKTAQKAHRAKRKKASKKKIK